jgi:hypothetical protein
MAAIDTRHVKVLRSRALRICACCLSVLPRLRGDIGSMLSAMDRIATTFAAKAD